MRRCLAIGSSGATGFCRTRPIQHFFELFLRVLLLYGLFTSSLGFRNVHSTKPLVPLIALSYDHQNHSKWHKWCHVRYTNHQTLSVVDSSGSSFMNRLQNDVIFHKIKSRRRHCCHSQRGHVIAFIISSLSPLSPRVNRPAEHLRAKGDIN